MAISDPIHVKNFMSNISEIRRLVEIHEKVAGPGVGHKAKVEVLNKRAVVLLVACWEAFVEDLAASSFEAMITNARSPSDFPSRVLVLSSDALRRSEDAREVWKLARDGSKAGLTQNK